MTGIVLWIASAIVLGFSGIVVIKVTAIQNQFIPVGMPT